MFLVGFLGWNLDAFDIFTVSLSITEIAKVYNYSTCCTDRVLTRLIHRVRVYAFGVPTRLRV